MNFRLPLFLVIALTAATLQAAEEAAPPAKPGWLKRAGQSIWPFKKKTGDAKAAEMGKAWKQLLPVLSVEPLPLKLAEARTLKVTLQLTNQGRKLVQLDFPTSQRIEVLLKDREGKLIERWSEDQSFENEPTLVAINPGERLVYSASVATRDLKAGQAYTIEGFFPNYEQLRSTYSITPEP